MKKIFFYIIIPLIILILCCTNAVLISKPYTSNLYKSSNTQIRFIDDVFYIKTFTDNQFELEDFGTIQDGEFISKKTNTKINDIKNINPFCLQYQNETLYCSSIIFLQCFLGLLIVGGIICCILGIIFINKSAIKKDG